MRTRGQTSEERSPSKKLQQIPKTIPKPLIRPPPPPSREVLRDWLRGWGGIARAVPGPGVADRPKTVSNGRPPRRRDTARAPPSVRASSGAGACPAPPPPPTALLEARLRGPPPPPRPVGRTLSTALGPAHTLMAPALCPRGTAPRDGQHATQSRRRAAPCDTCATEGPPKGLWSVGERGRPHMGRGH